MMMRPLSRDFPSRSCQRCVCHTCAGSCIHHHKAFLASHFARLQAASMHLLLDVQWQPRVTQSGLLSMLVCALQQGSKAGHTS